MDQTIESSPKSAMMQEVAQVREESRAVAKGAAKSEAEELPEGTSPVEARSSSSEGESEAAEETPATVEGSAATEDDGPIRIGGQTFSTQREAIAYAEQLEREKLQTDAHAAGIREALEATRVQATPTPEPEDNFDERFYSNPKEVIREMQVKARDEALAAIKAETQRESLWNNFLTEHPDVRRKDAERILNENWETIGKMTDLPKAMKLLAQKVRNEYEEIVNLSKPRTELANKRSVTTTSSGVATKGVTLSKKDDAPLDFIAQMKRLKGHA